MHLSLTLQVHPACRLSLAVTDRDALADLLNRLPFPGLAHLDVNLAYLHEAAVEQIAAVAAVHNRGTARTRGGEVGVREVDGTSSPRARGVVEQQGRHEQQKPAELLEPQQQQQSRETPSHTPLDPHTGTPTQQQPSPSSTLPRDQPGPCTPATTIAAPAPRSRPLTVGVWVCCWGGCPGLPLACAEELHRRLGPSLVALESVNCTGPADIIRLAAIVPSLTSLGFNLEGYSSGGPEAGAPVVGAADGAGAAASEGAGAAGGVGAAGGAGASRALQLARVTTAATALRRLTIHGSPPTGWDLDSGFIGMHGLGSDNSNRLDGGSCGGSGRGGSVATLQRAGHCGRPLPLAALTKLSLVRDWSPAPLPLAPLLAWGRLDDSLAELTLERSCLRAPGELRMLGTLRALRCLTLTLTVEPQELPGPGCFCKTGCSCGCSATCCAKSSSCSFGSDGGGGKLSRRGFVEHGVAGIWGSCRGGCRRGGRWGDEAKGGWGGGRGTVCGEGGDEGRAGELSSSLQQLRLGDASVDEHQQPEGTELEATGSGTPHGLQDEVQQHSPAAGGLGVHGGAASLPLPDGGESRNEDVDGGMLPGQVGVLDADLSWMRRLTNLESASLEVPLLDFGWLPPSLVDLDCLKFSDGGVTWVRCPEGVALPLLTRLALPPLGDNFDDDDKNDDDDGGGGGEGWEGLESDRVDATHGLQQGSGGNTPHAGGTQAPAAMQVPLIGKPSGSRVPCKAVSSCQRGRSTLEDYLIRAIAHSCQRLVDVNLGAWPITPRVAADAAAALWPARLRRLSVAAAEGEGRQGVAAAVRDVAPGLVLDLLDPPVPVYPWERVTIR